ncbi:hypothetical protein DFH08DRAFT_97779 [Mycena albidolilacea]|uniref:Uncharacterized protein n=1 Tax=Mycena albidolilacea TaxID=1033008 RepID=A0AAD7A7E2_9AGAR|nr:hypothetical protein DFH08DRAFT_97779 [Mycena albidolilacea]
MSPSVAVIALIRPATMPPSPPCHYRLSHRSRPRPSPFGPLASCICGPALPPSRVLAPRTLEAQYPLRATPSASTLSRTALRPSGGPCETADTRTPKNPAVNPPTPLSSPQPPSTKRRRLDPPPPSSCRVLRSVDLKWRVILRACILLFPPFFHFGSYYLFFNSLFFKLSLSLPLLFVTLSHYILFSFPSLPILFARRLARRPATATREMDWLLRPSLGPQAADDAASNSWLALRWLFRRTQRFFLVPHNHQKPNRNAQTNARAVPHLLRRDPHSRRPKPRNELAGNPLIANVRATSTVFDASSSSSN